MRYYLRVEGVNLDNFVYDTQDLSTIHGGGLLLLEAISWISVQFTQLNPVTTGASSGLFEFEAEHLSAAESFRDQIQSYLTSHPQLKHATLVVDVLPSSGADQLVLEREKLIALNRWRQMQSPMVAVPTQNRTTDRVCKIDQVRPATCPMPGPGGTTEWVSESVKSRREYGRRQKRKFYEQQTSTTISNGFSNDLDELTNDVRQGNLHHKMAVIYLDGNGFGALQNKECASTSKQKQFDQAIKGYRKDLLIAFIQFMGNNPGWISADSRYRLETLLWGGDEIIWVVPAWQGWRTLAFFFEKCRTWKFDGHTLTHGGGLVFCHHNAPIHRITELARKLAGLAKKKSRDENLFAYEILESFDHIGRDLEDFRKERCPQPIDPNEGVNPEVLILPGDGMQDVIPKMQILKEKLPRRKLHQIVRNLLSKTQAVSEDGQSSRRAERKRIIEQTVVKFDQPSKEVLDSVTPRLSGDPVRWLHISALWDYLI